MSIHKYRALAEELREANRDLHRRFSKVVDRDDPDDPATRAWAAAVERFNDKYGEMYSMGFRQQVERLKRISRFYAGLDGAGDKVDRSARPLTRGDTQALDAAIAFLEADPMCFGSGYMKAELIKYIKRLPLDEASAARLRAVALNVVDTRDGDEFRAFTRLACKASAPELRAELQARVDIARRAKWMLDALDRAETQRAALARKQRR